MKLTPIIVSLLCVCLFPAVSRVSAQEPKLISLLQIYDTATREISTVKEYPFLIEAPNWTKDGKYLIYNSGGSIWRIAADGTATEEKIDTGFANRCNNDHVLSPDGRRIAVSHSPEDDWKSRIYILPLAGGAPRLVTPEGPSYLHGWSPDGKWLSYCAERDGEYDVYVIEAVGGKEIRLTDTPGLDDGPEYSPCGHYIWFNSVRTGSMQVWRMKADGTEQTQMTADKERHSWFPHVSPDGKTVVFISYRKGDVEPGDHPPGKNVELRLMPAEGGEPETVVKLFGGQGSLNVNSWAPDSRRFAFVSYRYE